MAKKLPTAVPRTTLTPAEAAASLGVGPDFFNAEIRPHLRVIRRGRKTLIRVAELDRWAEGEESSSAVDDVEAAIPRPHPLTDPHREAA